MSRSVTIRAAKARFAQLVARAEAGEIITITRNNVPVAQLAPIARKASRQFGAMRGIISVGPEFFEPLPSDELAGRNE